MTRRECLTLLAAAGVIACGGPKASTTADPEQRTTVRVDNRSYLDMNIFLLVGSQRIRLGTAGGNKQTVLRIPPQYLFGISSLQFMADPIGGSRTPVSDTISVSAGDQVQLIIPPT
ncbi:MAG: hypothetical protein H7066_21755 [Cytophagaceae bacterium]|nr:hypothetical protein [Gemmatimonadaceae bacterium]